MLKKSLLVLGLMMLGYLIFSWKITSGPNLEFEIVFIQPRAVSNCKEMIRAHYISERPIPFIDLTIVRGEWGIPKFQTGTKEISEELQKFQIESKPDRVKIAIPFFEAGPGQYRLASLQYECIERKQAGLVHAEVTILLDRVRGNEARYPSQAFKVNFSSWPSGDPSVFGPRLAIRILNDQVLSVATEDISNYGFSKSGQYIENPFLKRAWAGANGRAETNGDTAQVPLNVTKINHVFYFLKNEKSEIAQGYVAPLPLPGESLVRLKFRNSESTDVTYTLSFYFYGENLSEMVYTKATRDSGSSTDVIQFLKDDLVYASTPLIWSSLYREYDFLGEPPDAPSSEMREELYADIQFASQLATALPKKR